MLWKLKQLNASKQVKTRKDILEDYINQPKKSGYRSIHILADMSYDAVVKNNNSKKVHPQNFVCEIQRRTQPQDFWRDLMHEFHYTGREFGIKQSTYQKLVSEMAERFLAEDHSRLHYEAYINQ